MNPNETPLGVLAFLALFAAAVAVAHSDAERSTATMRRTYGIWVAMIRVGDRMAAKADTQTAKEWEAAKEGRSLRGPDGRWLKTDTDKEHP